MTQLALDFNWRSRLIAEHSIARVAWNVLAAWELVCKHEREL